MELTDFDHSLQIFNKPEKVCKFKFCNYYTCSNNTSIDRYIINTSNI